MPRNLGARGALLLTLATLVLPHALPGQARAEALASWSPSLSSPPEALPPPRPSTGVPRPIRWYHGLAALGAVAVLTLGDETLQDETQSHRTSGGDDLARAARRLGEFPVYAVPALGTLAAGGLGDEIGSVPVSVALYGAAGLTAWSRVNDNRHWASDVAAGALVGIASAKLMNGRWRVFGISAPGFLLEPGGVGIRAAF